VNLELGITTDSDRDVDASVILWSTFRGNLMYVYNGYAAHKCLLNWATLIWDSNDFYSATTEAVDHRDVGVYVSKASAIYERWPYYISQDEDVINYVKGLPDRIFNFTLYVWQAGHYRL